MKGVSFSLSSKPPNKTLKPPQNFNTDDEPPSPPTIEFLTEFDPSESLPQSKTLVIPPKPNQWLSHFEVDPDAERSSSDPDISYGLNLRQSANNNFAGEESKPYDLDRLMVKKLREDLDGLPEDRGFEDFDDVPVEGFGAALLAGYGWYEGRGIGKNHKEDTEIVEYQRRIGREGLGFVATISNTVIVGDPSDIGY